MFNQQSNKGAIRSTLSAVANTARVVDIAMEIAIINLQTTLEEEKAEALLRLQELQQSSATKK
jgi:hypothetical protein